MSTVIWAAPTSGTMTAARLFERGLYGARANLYGNAITIYWTDDGTATGNSLFSTTYMPWVEVVAADTLDPQAWTNAAMWGPMLRSDYMANMTPYCWETHYDSTNSIWFTYVSQGNPANTVGTAGTHALDGRRAGASVILAKRPIFLYALDLAA